MATLDDLKESFESLNESVTALKISFDTLLPKGDKESLELMKEQKKTLDGILGIEKNREKQKSDTSFVEPTKEKTGADMPKEKSAATASGEEWGSLLSSFSGLLAGAAALGLAFAGLRGWEVKIIDYVKDGLGSIKNSIIGGLKSIKTSIFFAFGLDVAGEVLPNSALDDLLKTPIIQKITAGLSKMLAPLKMMGDFLGGLFSGTGGDAQTGKAIKFLGEIGDNVSAFAGTVGKILKPIGFLFSAYDGVMAFMNKEGSFMDKFVAGIGGFIGDFIGAPLDLLKDIVSWGVSKLGFENAAEFLDGFSFETIINDLINGVWNMLTGAVEWVGTLFTDPGTALTQYWNTIYGENGLIDMLFTPISMAIDWITKKFGWRDEDAPPFDLYETVKGFVVPILTWVDEKLASLSNTLSEGFDTFVDYIVSIPDRIKFAAEGMFIDVGEKIAKGFISFGDWMASIPARIKAMALGVLNSISVTNPITGTVYKLVGDEELAAAQAAVTDRASSTNEKLKNIEANANKMRENLESRMAASGIYDSAAAATAESPVASNNAERIRLDRDRQTAMDFQKKIEAVSKGDPRLNMPVTSISGSGNTDARQTSTNINITNNQTQRNYRELNQATGMGF